MNSPKARGARTVHGAKGRQAKAAPGGAASCEWEAEAAACRGAKWDGGKGHPVMLRFEEPLLTVSARIPKSFPSLPEPPALVLWPVPSSPSPRSPGVQSMKLGLRPTPGRGDAGGSALDSLSGQG